MTTFKASVSCGLGLGEIGREVRVKLELALGVRIRARLGPSWIGFRLGPY